jgi:hypothetical protein
MAGLEYGYRGGTVAMNVNGDNGVVRGLKRYVHLDRDVLFLQ